jgi:hypothetical protein
VARVGDFAIEIIRSLPQSYGDRFWFDAGLIQAMANDWSEQRVFSSMLAPRYERQWGYTRLPMPLSEAPSVPGESRHHIVELIRLPGNDDLGHVDLLRYPFIGHELAHSLMFRYDEALIPLVRPVVAAAIRRLRLAAVPDRGRARAVSQNAIEECVGFWSPTPDHWNWTHELYWQKESKSCQRSPNSEEAFSLKCFLSDSRRIPAMTTRPCGSEIVATKLPSKDTR